MVAGGLQTRRDGEIDGDSAPARERATKRWTFRRAGVKPLPLEGIVLAVGFAVASLMLLVPREHGER
jgi:hypothetical protein